MVQCAMITLAIKPFNNVTISCALNDLVFIILTLINYNSQINFTLPINNWDRLITLIVFHLNPNGNPTDGMHLCDKSNKLTKL